MALGWMTEQLKVLDDAEESLDKAIIGLVNNFE